MNDPSGPSDERRPGSDPDVKSDLDLSRDLGRELGRELHAGSASMVGGSSELEVTLEGHGDDRPPAPASIGWSPGQRVARFVITERVGAGAMGVVYAAYDPELDRRVALKVLRPRSGGSDSTQGRARLMREAQALARLRHPNVVAIHDVGTFRDRVYLAMEFVEGEVVSDWLASKSPSLAERIEVFAAAARGLHAAHQADMVHRDFKPENVVVSAEGEVRVLDFGLARSAGLDSNAVTASNSSSKDSGRQAALQASGGVALERDAALSSASLDVELTQTGGVIGTPAYMSPEQHLGEHITPASDQFSFCVTLWEALYGVRPFPGETMASLAFNVTQGKLAEVPKGRGVPNWLRQLLERGLAAAPSDRWPSMAALVQALESDPIARRKRRTLALVGAAAGLGLLGIAAWGGAEAAQRDPCAQADSAANATWTPERGGKVSRAFEATGLGFAAQSASRVNARIDGWTQDWRTQSIRSCRATRVQQTQSAALLDRRSACLSRALARADSLIQRFEQASPESVEHAVEALAGLPALDACADTERLLTQSESLTGPAKQEADALASELDKVNALTLTGAHKEGIEHALTLETRVKDLQHAQTSMRFEGLLGMLRDSDEENLKAAMRFEQAYAAAERAGDNAQRVRWATRAAGTWGYGLAKSERASPWLVVATSALEGLKTGNELHAGLAADLELTRGTLLLKQGEMGPAVESLERAVAMFEDARPDPRNMFFARQRLAVALREKGENARAQADQEALLAYVVQFEGPDHPRTATVLGSLGNTAFSRSDYDTAVEYFERALKIVATAYGEDSPRYYDRLNNYAAALWGQGDFARAEATHRKILAYNTERFGAEDLRLTPSLENLGNCLISQRRYEEAAESIGRSLELRLKIYGADHPKTATSEMNLGVVYYNLGRYKEAERLYMHTLQVWRSKLGEAHADLGLVHSNLGDLELAKGNARKAAQHQRKALELFEPTFGKDNAELGWPLTGLALAQLHARDAAGALETLIRARRLREGAVLPAGERARMDFAYLRARARLDPQTPIDAALLSAVLEDAKGGEPKQLAQIEAWAAQHK